MPRPETFILTSYELGIIVFPFPRQIKVQEIKKLAEEYMAIPKYRHHKWYIITPDSKALNNIIGRLTIESSKYFAIPDIHETDIIDHLISILASLVNTYIAYRDRDVTVAMQIHQQIRASWLALLEIMFGFKYAMQHLYDLTDPQDPEDLDTAIDRAIISHLTK